MRSFESRFEARAGGLTGFIGREEECEHLLERKLAWQGRGQVVLVSGEAGIGKSRLTAWLTEKVAAEPHIRLRYQCTPHHRDSALYPVIATLERAAGIAAGDAPEVKLGKLEALLALAALDTTAVAPLFAAEIHRCRGEILARYFPKRIEAAEEALHQALAVSRAQQTRSFELRAALDLAHRYRDTDREREAHDLLGPALVGFTETPELTEIGEAQRLLASLD